MDRHNNDSSPRTLALLAVSSIAVVGCGGFVIANRLDTRLEQMDTQSRERAGVYQSLQERLETVRQDLVYLREDLQAVGVQEDETRQHLLARLNSAEDQLGSIGCAVEAQASNLNRLEEVQASFVPELEAEFAVRDERLQNRWETLNALATRAHHTADENLRRVEEIAAPRDLARMWRELVGPIVQIAGDTSVGSGVLLRSNFNAEAGDYQTYLLTAWHVVRDIQGVPGSDEPVSVAIYHEDGDIRREVAELLTFEPDLDAALLLIRSQDDLGNGAAIASRERLGKIRIFDEIYAVGCPLGNDPIPTRGEIATRKHDVEGDNYWMINAPTYIGNSGGGIFDGENHELLGIFSKIYTHGSLRPTIVPHMGLVTPLSSIYEWLDSEGYSEVFESADSDHLANASADR